MGKKLEEMSDAELDSLLAKDKTKKLEDMSDAELDSMIAKSEPPKEKSFGRKAGEFLAEQAPVAGMVGGGILGGLSSGGLAAAGGAAVGGMAGKHLENLIKENLLDERGDYDYTSPAVEGALGELGGQALTTGLSKAGKAVYSHGLKPITDAITEYGMANGADIIAKDLQDKLLSLGVRGSPAEIFKQIKGIGEEKASKVFAILKESTKRGAEVDMDLATKNTVDRIRQIRLSKDPQLQPLADELEKQVAQYKALSPSEPTQVIRELPVQSKFNPAMSEVSFNKKTVEGSLPVQGRQSIYPGSGKPGAEITLKNQEVPFSYSQSEVIPGKTINESYTQLSPVKVLDETERVAGPTPLQGNQYKQSLTAGIPGKAWGVNQHNPLWIAEQKALASGMREATEQSVEQSLGPQSRQDLVNLNRDWGNMIEAGDAAAKMAKQRSFQGHPIAEIAKTGMFGWKYPLFKASEELLFTSSAQTRLGYLMNKAGEHQYTKKFARPLLSEGLNLMDSRPIGDK